MIRGFKDNNRRVLPTWRDFKTTMNLGELGSGRIKLTNRINTKSLENAKFQWDNNKELPFAAELVSNAIIADNHPIAKDAAEYILKNSSNQSDLLVSMCKRILDQDGSPCETKEPNISSNDTSQFYSNIKGLKLLLSQNPLNAVAWVDLARNYIILGNEDKAHNAAKVAMQLSPENRFILRSVARFLVHIGDVQRAHEILRKSEIVKFDPWVLASEISIGNMLNRTSNHIKKAREITNSNKFSPFDICELQSTLGTLEFCAGNNKTTKKLLSLSLQNPNDNTLAQVIWISKWLHLPQFKADIEQFNTVPCAYEANAISLYLAGDWDKAFKETELWMADQPYSSRPALFASHIAASCLEDFQKSESILKKIIVSNPNDNMILNNLAYSLINQDKITEAERVLSQFNNPIGINEQIVWHATHGLLFFRRGHIGQGREFYTKAINIANKDGSQDQKALAALLLAKEEFKSLTPEANKSFEFAEELAKKSKNLVVLNIYDKLKKTIHKQKESIL